MSLFRKWKTQHQVYFDRSPCVFWPNLTYDLRASSYGAGVPFTVTDGFQAHTVAMNIRRLKYMKARDVEIGELRVMHVIEGQPEVLQYLSTYHTYIVGYDRLVIVNPFGNITCKESL